MRQAGFNCRGINVEPMAGQGIYQASSSKPLPWTVTQRVSAPCFVSIQFAVRVLAAKTALLPWNMQSRVGQSVAPQWVVCNHISAQFAFPWGVRSISFCQSSASWDVRNTAAAESLAGWDVRSLVGGSASSLQWGVFQSATASILAEWIVTGSVMRCEKFGWRIPFAARSNRPSFSFVGTGSALTRHVQTTSLEG